MNKLIKTLSCFLKDRPSWALKKFLPTLVQCLHKSRIAYDNAYNGIKVKKCHLSTKQISSSQCVSLHCVLDDEGSSVFLISIEPTMDLDQYPREISLCSIHSYGTFCPQMETLRLFSHMMNPLDPAADPCFTIHRS